MILIRLISVTESLKPSRKLYCLSTKYQSETKAQFFQSSSTNTSYCVAFLYKKVCAKRLMVVCHTECNSHVSHFARKPVFGVSDQVRHKPGCAATEDSWRHALLDLEKIWTVLSM